MYIRTEVYFFSYLMYCRRILIDTGNFNKLEYIKNLQKTMATYKFQINHMIITHWHPDHIGGVINVLNMINNKNGIYSYIIFVICMYTYINKFKENMIFFLYF